MQPLHRIYDLITYLTYELAKVAQKNLHIWVLNVLKKTIVIEIWRFTNGKSDLNIGTWI
jgi:hypothetical protein